MHTHRYKLLAFAVDFLKSLVPIKLINLAAVPDGPDIISVCVKCDNSYNSNNSCNSKEAGER